MIGLFIKFSQTEFHCCHQVEYDLENSSHDDLRILSSDRVEQSGIAQCMLWYPPITKESFILTANDQVGQLKFITLYILCISVHFIRIFVYLCTFLCAYVLCTIKKIQYNLHL